jgi:hypothetical protein
LYRGSGINGRFSIFARRGIGDLASVILSAAITHVMTELTGVPPKNESAPGTRKSGQRIGRRAAFSSCALSSAEADNPGPGPT